MRQVPEVPTGVRSRLTAHYGPVGDAWLRNVPALLSEVERQWGLEMLGYHDAGWASVLAVMHNPSGERVLVKAWFDHDRFRHEVDALRYWRPPLVPALDAVAPKLR
jgi:streptomycin 6-kinase